MVQNAGPTFQTKLGAPTAASLIQVSAEAKGKTLAK